MDNTPVSCRQLASYFHLDGKQLQEQYKEHISHFHQWEQRQHASDWLLFPQNLGPELSIDETALSNGELYTILTNKAAKGRKGALVAMIKGTLGGHHWSAGRYTGGGQSQSTGGAPGYGPWHGQGREKLLSPSRPGH